MNKKKKPARKRTKVSIVNKNQDVVYSAPTPDQMIMVAIKEGRIEMLEKLMALQERWKANIALEKYNEARSIFQKIGPDLQKNVKVSYKAKNNNTMVEYKYQDLPDIAKQIRGALAECGLAYDWDQKEDGVDIKVRLVIRHSGGHVERGEWLSAKLDSSGGKEGIHAKGSTITYLQRYTLKAGLGLSSADPDDDGRLAVRHQSAVEERNGERSTPELPKQRLAKLPLDNELQEKLIQQFIDGTITLEEIEKNHSLSDVQLKAFAVVEKNRKK